MNVAVPGPSRPLQHSPTFGHEASSQTVLRSWSRSVCFISVNRSPDGGRIFSQSGFRDRLITGTWGRRGKSLGCRRPGTEPDLAPRSEVPV